MGKNKLRKFKEMDELKCVFQYPFSVLRESGFPMKGNWGRGFFGNDNPIVLELGCGKGEYTVGLAERFPDKNLIGIDIKGARMWTGACQVRDRNITNAAFLRTNIELLPYFFAPGEIDGIWITFPDPQMKKVNKRLTGTRFCNLYRNVLKDGGVVHLKSDSPFLYTYTKAMVEHNSLAKIDDTPDLYNDLHYAGSDILNIRTFYERQWLERGLSIKYISWHLDHASALSEPEIDIEPDTYRSFSRGELQCPESVDKLQIT